MYTYLVFFFFSVFWLGVLYLLLRFLSLYELLAKTYAGMYNVKSVPAASLVCEKSRPSSLLACVSQKTRKLLGPGNRPAKLPKRLSGVSQSTRKILTPKNTSFSPVNFTGTHYFPKSVFGSVFLVLA